MIRILHTNDLHGSMTPTVFEQLRQIREEVDGYFDSGDAIKTGNLGIPTSEDPVWQYFARLECTASVLGNRETHPIETFFLQKLKGAQHPVLAGNLLKKGGESPLRASLIWEVGGKRIGVISTMVAMVTERMKTQFASAYLWDTPIPTAIRLAQELRPQVDHLFALTHIGHTQDLKLAEQCPEIDVIFGGHSHTVLMEPVQCGGTWIAQGGSHARYAGVYQYDGEKLTGGLRSLIR